MRPVQTTVKNSGLLEKEKRTKVVRLQPRDVSTLQLHANMAAVAVQAAAEHQMSGSLIVLESVLDHDTLK